MKRFSGRGADEDVEDSMRDKGIPPRNYSRRNALNASANLPCHTCALAARWCADVGRACMRFYGTICTHEETACAKTVRKPMTPERWTEESLDPRLRALTRIAPIVREAYRSKQFFLCRHHPRLRPFLFLKEKNDNVQARVDDVSKRTSSNKDLRHCFQKSYMRNLSFSSACRQKMRSAFVEAHCGTLGRYPLAA